MNIIGKTEENYNEKEVIKNLNEVKKNYSKKTNFKKESLIFDHETAVRVWKNETKSSSILSISLEQKWRRTPTGIGFFDNVCILNLKFNKTFSHCWTDSLRTLLKFDAESNYDAIFVPKTKQFDELIHGIKIKFKKIIFISNSECFFAKKITFELEGVFRRNINDVKRIKNLVDSISEPTQVKFFLYCTRNRGGNVSNGRLMKEDNEKKIINLSKEYCENQNLIFKIFDGNNERGERMSIRQQIDAFKKAKVVVGPHGGAFANIISMQKDQNAIVCEFTSGSNTCLQDIAHFGKNYNQILGFLPETYLNYYLIPFESGSNQERTFIDINNYRKFLKDIKIGSMNLKTQKTIS